MRRDINSLLDRLERVRLAWECAPELDPLSICLLQFEREMAMLDEAGIAALAEETDENGRRMGLENAQEFVASFRDRWRRRNGC